MCICDDLTNVKSPVIGISCAFDFDSNFSYSKQGYYNAIIKCGGIPMLIPVNKDINYIKGVVSVIDGLLLSGGPDLDPMYYREETSPWNGNISPDRDEMDLALARMTVSVGKPVLGICRGMQLLNVAMGGTLYQDIRSQIKRDDLLQHDQKAPVWYASHRVKLKEGSIIYGCFQEPEPRVNSFHHQAVKSLAEDLTATAWTSDGVIEAYEKKTEGFALGVQWHPECMWEKNEVHLGVFRCFLEAAK